MMSGEQQQQQMNTVLELLKDLKLTIQNQNQEFQEHNGQWFCN